MAHQVPLERPWRGMSKLARMVAMAIEECLACVARERWPGIPLLLCVAESDRPGRYAGLDERLLPEVMQLLGADFSTQSAVIAYGRVSVALATHQARRLILEQKFDHVLIAAADSLLNYQTLHYYETGDRLLTASNSNGFMPGEGAGALLVGKPNNGGGLACTGIGFGVETAGINSDEPLLASGLANAIENALHDAGHGEGLLQLRITDISGEQYYFKEASIAFSRLDRTKRGSFDFWHPAECVGETCAAIGTIMIASLAAATAKGYAEGKHVLAHMANDDGARASLIFSCDPMY